tara:strand:- start:4328 stop:4552 length:225 start_codon:yes stop_codon:yes gene_type:complete
MGLLEDLESSETQHEVAQNQAVLRFIRYLVGDEFKDWAEHQAVDPERPVEYEPEPLMRTDSTGNVESEEEQDNA